MAGLIAAKDNSLGMRGVAPEAKIYGYNYLAEQTAANEADAMSRNAAITAISNNSWGPGDSGLPVTATDPDSDPLIYSLGGPDLVSFDLVSSTGQLRTKAALDYEDKDSYTVTVSVSDGKDTDGDPDSSIDDEITVTITVTNVDETGSLSLRPAQPLVGTAYETIFSDPDALVGQAVWTWERSSDKTSWTGITDFGTDRLSHGRTMPAPAGPIYVPTGGPRDVPARDGELHGRRWFRQDTQCRFRARGWSAGVVASADGGHFRNRSDRPLGPRLHS